MSFSFSGDIYLNFLLNKKLCARRIRRLTSSVTNEVIDQQLFRSLSMEKRSDLNSAYEGT